MLKTIRKWKKYLSEGRGLAEYSSGGIITLYHYSRMDEEELLLDPNYFISNRSPYSRNDYNVSAYPRIFFYTNLDEAEPVVKSTKLLYSTTVPEYKIYDLTEDSDNLRERSIGQYSTAPNLDVIIRAVAGQPVTVDGALIALKKEYDGIYYRVGNMGIVAWFKPIVVDKVVEGQ